MDELAEAGIIVLAGLPSQRTMFANGADGSIALVASLQKHASSQYHRPLLPLRMMCSQVSAPWGPAILCGRIEVGGIAGGSWSFGFGGGLSYTLSHTGMCLHTPSPLQSHSQEQSA